MNASENDLDHDKVNLETSQIRWQELLRFFANGSTVFVAPDLDLINVAMHFTEDNKAQVEKWMQAEQVHIVTDQQAKDWVDNDAIVWAVVIKPWVLVQPV